MKAVTIGEAKARLNALVEAAERGEQVVLMRGSKHVAVIIPVSEEDLEIAPRLAGAQAERLWRELEDERRRGAAAIYDTVEEVVSYLRARETPGSPTGARKPKKRSRVKRRR